MLWGPEKKILKKKYYLLFIIAAGFGWGGDRAGPKKQRKN
jgi:hypothetical protein